MTDILADYREWAAEQPERIGTHSDYASRYGYLLGGLEMVAAGQASADKVLESYKQKYETKPEPDAACPAS